MEFRVLAIGDVVGENGLDLLVRRLRPLKREKQVRPRKQRKLWMWKVPRVQKQRQPR